ncbi:endonuclease/exonuclease/phosphatase family protein [Curtobacterium sp. 9128]|uniref:endonuclease/exonuclease/phosphatase family protein n=1 Tax=Curtobacterium sp. 9128 TaxID=1793722 RepID=UPI0016428D1C|nr:endonuclease/exonuclease/phosphatase family protein [Curtobacterium sp. 9128]
MGNAARPITLMTYNIKNPKPQHDWPSRLPVLLDIVRRHDPDVLCVQEAFDHQMDDLRQGLPEHADVGQGREGGTAGEHAAVFFRRDRLRPMDEGSFWLSDTPDEPVSNTWGSLFPRIANHVRFLDAEGEAFTLLTTHLDHEPNAHGDEVRGKSAALIVERLAGVDGPVVFAGDCNEPAGTGAASRVFADAGYADAWTVAGDPSDLTATYNDWEPPVASGERIDWVLTKGVAGVDRVLIDHDGPETWFASDHFPVVAQIRI